MTTARGKISLQTERLALLTRYAEGAHANVYESLSAAEVTTKLAILEQYWDAFQGTHVALADLSGSEAAENPYNSEENLVRALNAYGAAKVALLTRQDELSSLSRREATELANASLPELAAQRTLPDIPVPTFSGNFADWRSYRDLFTSMVTDNARIPTVEKMHYLQMSLKGEAAQLTSNLPISAAAFDSAWALLTARFENKRILINAQLEKLFGQSTINSRSARELNFLLNSTMEALHALHALGAPTEHWDMVLVYNLVTKLDPKTREAWEVKLGSSTEVPTFDSLRAFLTGRARALESLGLGMAPPSSARSGTPLRSTSGSTPARRQAPVTVHAVTAPLTQAYPCSKCSGDHFVVACPAFRGLSIAHRRQFVISERLCFNCLGKHNASACNSSKRCQECGNKHHTMIHTEDRPAPVARAPPRPTTSLSSVTSPSLSPLTEESPSQASTPRSEQGQSSRSTSPA